MKFIESIAVPILDVEYAQRHVEHASIVLDTIYNTGGIIQSSDMQNLCNTLRELKVQLKVYRTSINQFEKDVKETIK